MSDESGNLKKEGGFAASYARVVMKLRWPIIVAILIVTGLLATQIQHLNIRNDPDTLLPPSNRYVATNLYGEQKFGMGNLMVMGFIVKEGDMYQPWYVNMVQEVHKKMEALPNSRGQNFMDIAAQKIKYMGKGDDGGLVFRRLIPVSGISTDDADKAKEELAFLKKGLEGNPVLAPMLVYKASDATGERCEYGQSGCTAKGTFIIADYDDGVKDIYLPWVKSVLDIVKETEEKYGDRVEVLVAGEPYFLAYMLYDLVQKWWLFVVSLLIVVAILWKELRDWRGALFPMIGVFITIALTLGLMGFTQFKLTTMMVLTPMLLLAIGTGHAVQVTRRFLDELVKDNCDVNKAAEHAIAHTIIPATLAIVTDMVGFFTLSFVDISFYKAYAYFGMFGMMTILLTVTTLIPILMSIFPPDVKKHKDLCGAAAFEEKMAKGLSSMVVGSKKWIPLLAVVLLVGWSAKETRIYEGTAEDIMPGVEKGINYARAAFKEESITIQHIKRLSQVMPGVISVNIPFKGKEPLKTVCIDEDDDGNPMSRVKGCLAECEEGDGSPLLKVNSCLCNDEDDDGNLLPKGCYDEDKLEIQGIINDAEVLAAIEKMEDWMRAHPYIGFTGSYVQYIKLVNMLMVSEGKESDMSLFHVPSDAFIKTRMADYGDAEDPEYVPNANDIISSYNGLLEANTSPGDLDSFVSRDWNEGVIMGFVNTMDPVKTHQTVVDIQTFIRENKDAPGFEKIKIGFKIGDTVNMPETNTSVTLQGDANISDPAVGGFLGATEATREVATTEWLKSPLQTALAIFLIAAIMFRSVVVSGILVVMLGITLFAQYGLGAYFTRVENWSGNLHFATLVSLSIAMGLGVDYGIYMISRLREEMQATAQNWKQALENTLTSTGSAVFSSVIVLLGSFVPLLGTELANTWALGIFISEALIIDVFTALTILPLLIYWFKPKYVFQKS